MNKRFSGLSRESFFDYVFPIWYYINMKDNSIKKDNKDIGYDWKKDKSFFSLLLSNIFSIVLMVWSNASIFTVFMVYWIQLAIIGFFTYIRLIKIKDYRTDGFKINNQPVTPSKETNKKVSSIFLSMYSFGMLCLLFFIIIGYPDIDIFVVLSTGVWFFFNHLYSFKVNYKELMNGGDIGQICGNPILRLFFFAGIIAVIFGCYAFMPLIILLILKTYIDLMIHMVKHGKVFSLRYYKTVIAVIMALPLIIFAAIYLYIGLVWLLVSMGVIK